MVVLFLREPDSPNDMLLDQTGSSIETPDVQRHDVWSPWDSERWQESQLLAAYHWVYWNQHGRLELWSNDVATWKPDWNPRSQVHYGRWEKLVESLHVTFLQPERHWGLEEYNFLRLVPGFDFWALHQPTSAAEWCLLAPAH